MNLILCKRKKSARAGYIFWIRMALNAIVKVFKEKSVKDDKPRYDEIEVKKPL